ncbi:MAG TPA: TRAP transporter small permease [Hyphomicrobiaceae bacterium]|nr:TRAP transporter small permease [Hyphomicrobiaceae bacterium]
MLARLAYACRLLTRIVAGLLQVSLVAAVLVMLACIVAQVVMRYVVGQSLSWSEELAILMFAWATLGGLAFGVREGFHVRLDILLETLAPAARRQAERAIEALTAFLGAYLAWSGVRFLDFTAGTVSAAIGYPIEIMNVLAPIAGVLICLFAAERLLIGPAQPAADRPS